MIRKIFCLIMALALICGLILTVSARETGILRVLPLCGSREVPGGTVTVYRIGEPVPGGFRLTGKLSHNVLPEKDALSEKFLQWMLRRLPKNGIDAPVKKHRGAVYEDLEAGLYVVKQTCAAPGYTSFSPFLITVPMEGKWELTANPKVTENDAIPETGDDFSLVFGLVGMAVSLLGFAFMEGKRRR